MSWGRWLHHSLLVTAGLVLAACAGILDIKERHLRTNEGDGGPGVSGPGGSSPGPDSSASTGSGGHAGTGGTGSSGTGSSGTGSGGMGPDATVTCPMPGQSECTTCLCTRCDPSLLAACEGGGCLAVMDCVVRSGCTDPATCALPTVCGPTFQDFPEQSALLDCVRLCSSCTTAGPCVGRPEGMACTAIDGTGGVCRSGTCETGSTCAGVTVAEPCSAPGIAAGICQGGFCKTCLMPGGRDPACAGYGPGKDCCSAQGSCEACSATSPCNAATEGQPCTDGLAGICMGGICQTCVPSVPASSPSPRCLAAYGPAKECCSPAHVCEACPATTSCNATTEGKACTHPTQGPGICQAAICSLCTASPGTGDPRCLTAYGPAQECCSAAGSCTACGAGCSPGAACPLPAGGSGTCLPSRTCVECATANGTQDPNCAILHGAAASCCYSNQCASCLASCNDGVKNGTESDVDCGGPACTPCGLGKNCAVATDCVGSGCVGGTCAFSCVGKPEGIACMAIDGTGGVCRSGTCEPVSTCVGVFQDCDSSISGCETDVMSNFQHCGACNSPCTNAHGLPGCTAGVCTPFCAAGYGDCDGNPRNGCETDVRSNLQHCGACNSLCSGSACVASVCTAAAGLIDEWRFDEGGGGIAQDTGPLASSAGASLFGTAWLSGPSCHSGSCLHFDGTSYATTVASPNWAFGTGDFTVAFWLRSETNDDRRPLVNNRTLSGGAAQWSVEIYTVANQVELHTGVADPLHATQLIVSGAWNHVAVTRSAGIATIYVNRVSAGSAPVGEDFSQVNPLQFGRDLNPVNDLAGKTFIGALDDVRIYNRALPPVEITALP